MRQCQPELSYLLNLKNLVYSQTDLDYIFQFPTWTSWHQDEVGQAVHSKWMSLQVPTASPPLKGPNLVRRRTFVLGISHGTGPNWCVPRKIFWKHQKSSKATDKLISNLESPLGISTQSLPPSVVGRALIPARTPRPRPRGTASTRLCTVRPITPIIPWCFKNAEPWMAMRCDEWGA